jgi:hypothetical protein
MLTQEQLQALATAMTQKDQGSTRRIDAGYTYLGQFISHELVTATPRPGDRTLPRVVSPLLALDSVYGRPHEMEAWLTDGRFATPAPLPEDLVRNEEGVAQIPEPRNDDNVIIAQLHRFWQRLHNFLLDEKLTNNAVQARQWVTKVVQLLVVEDFLQQLLEPSVFRSYFRSDERWLSFDRCGIPPHFSHAAYRFGHSMIRASYEGFDKSLKDGNRDLQELLRQGRLTPANVINWPEFFGEPIRENGVQDAMAIDPFVVIPMTAIPDPTQAIHIVRANLEAGQRVHLPAGKAYVMELLNGPHGQQLRDKFGLAPLAGLDVMLSQHLPAGSGITIDNLPLWPYVLLEAALPPANGERLGVLGSLICAEVIGQAIRNARVTIYANGWPSVDEVLATLGPLGPQLKKQRKPQGSEPAPLREMCMHHVIQLVLSRNPN